MDEQSFTAEQRAHSLDSGGDECPFCLGNEDGIDRIPSPAGQLLGYQDVVCTCESCQAEWILSFKLENTWLTEAPEESEATPID